MDVHQIYEEVWKDEADTDPQSVNNLLTKELLQLSLKDRTAIQEEIHGVACLAPEETPELLGVSLLQLAVTLENDDIIPPNTKHAYWRSQRLPNSYVNEVNFRLRFLRFTCFDVLKAAEKMVRFLRVALELFGEFALERAVRLSDFDDLELKYLREGEFQFLPFRDQSGRRILVFMNPLMPREDSETFRIRAKIMLYMTWTAGDDVDVQRKGLVFLIRFTSKYEVSTDMHKIREIPRNQPHIICTVRPSSVHICSPDKPLFRFAHAIIQFRIHQVGRDKMKIHLGGPVELQYALHSYGIPTEHIPLTFSGNIKDGNMKQWMKLRGYAECEEYESEVIECPKLEDVLFRQGAHSLSYAGNARVHRLVEKRYKQDSNTVLPKRGTVKSKREKVVLEIIDYIRSIGGRFLVWNDNGWWNEIVEIGPLSTKLIYFIKEALKAKRKDERLAKSRHHRLHLDCSTSMFQTQRDEDGCSNKRTKFES